MTAIPTPRQAALPPASVPSLVDGDRLTRQEFHRRYEATPEHVRAELVEGIVYMASPVSFRRHGRHHLRLAMWLGEYVYATPGVDAGVDSTVQLDPDNEPQPDVSLLILPAHGGQSIVDGDEDYIVGAPEFAAEVAASSARRDAHQKREAYRRNGVREYFIWRTAEAAIDWFVLRDRRYEQLSPDAAGVVRSETFPGLWLDVPALLRDDLPAVSAAIKNGIASPEHAAFVERLRQQAGKK
jgi:hypothetical protein